MIVLALTAYAAPTDLTELVGAEEAATALILDCAARGVACGASAAQLGEAFVVRAAAASVLRGEIDATSAANARYLAPDVADAWAAVLPATGEPDAWVVAWHGAVPAAAAPPVLPERRARAPYVPADPGSLVATLGVRGAVVDDTTTMDATLSGRVGLGGPIGVFAEVTGRQDATRLTDLEGIGVPDGTRFTSLGTELSLGVGPRFTTERGGELALFGLGTFDDAGVSPGTRRRLEEENQVAVSPGAWGLGGALGVLGFHPVSRAVAFGWEARVGAHKRWRHRGDPLLWDVEDRDADARDLADGQVSVQVRWRPRGGAFSLAPFGRADVLAWLGPLPDPSVSRTDGWFSGGVTAGLVFD